MILNLNIRIAPETLKQQNEMKPPVSRIFLSYFEKNSSCVIVVSVCIFVALWICGLVCLDVCCRGQ